MRVGIIDQSCLGQATYGVVSRYRAREKNYKAYPLAAKFCGQRNNQTVVITVNDHRKKHGVFPNDQILTTSVSDFQSCCYAVTPWFESNFRQESKPLENTDQALVFVGHLKCPSWYHASDTTTANQDVEPRLREFYVAFSISVAGRRRHQKGACLISMKMENST